MDTSKILSDLRAERDRIDRAIAAIEGLNSAGRRRAGRPPRAAAARRKLSRLLKQRWAQGKMRLRAKAKPVQAKPARHMSKAARKKIAAAQRARWAKVKAQRKAA